MVGLEALFKVNRKEVNKDVRILFKSWIDITTVVQYIGVCKQLLCYIFRSKDVEAEKRLGFELTKRQKM